VNFGRYLAGLHPESGVHNHVLGWHFDYYFPSEFTFKHGYLRLDNWGREDVYIFLLLWLNDTVVEGTVELFFKIEIGLLCLKTQILFATLAGNCSKCTLEVGLMLITGHFLEDEFEIWQRHVGNLCQIASQTQQVLLCMLVAP
jgi:hypothetical protein